MSLVTIPRFAEAASRRAYAGTAPITRPSGKSRVVLVRHARNKRLGDACRWWAFQATQRSPGAKAYYQQRRVAGMGMKRPSVGWPTSCSASCTTA